MHKKIPYQSPTQAIEAFLLLIPVVLIGVAGWYLHTFPEELDRMVLGGKTHITTGKVTQIIVDTQLVQKRWKDNLLIRYQVGYEFEIMDSTYQGVQILADTWKNKSWIQRQLASPERIPVEYSISQPWKNRMAVERVIK